MAQGPFFRFSLRSSLIAMFLAPFVSLASSGPAAFAEEETRVFGLDANVEFPIEQEVTNPELITIASPSREAVEEYLEQLFEWETAQSRPFDETYEGFAPLPNDMFPCSVDTCSGQWTGRPIASLTLYSADTDYSEFEAACGFLEDFATWIDCAESVGCWGTEDGPDEAYVVCPFTIVQESASFTINLDDHLVVGAADPSSAQPLDSTDSSLPEDDPEGEPPATQEEAVATDSEPKTQRAIALTDESVFGDLPTLGPPEQVLRQLAVGSAVAVVFIVLVLLPTQLINSVLEVHGAALQARVRSALTRRKNREAGLAGGSTTRAKKTLNALIVFFLAGLIAGFVEPDFGLNAMSLRLFLTGFISFLIINFVAIVLVWMLYRRKAPVKMPNLEVHYSYLAVIAATVFVSRLLELEPVVVFGVVLVIESGRVVASAARQLEHLPGRLAYTSGLLTLGLGIVSYSGYLLSRALWAGDSFLEVTLRELFAIVTIEALATLPVLLLPLTFLPGYDLFRWSRVRWFIAFASSITLFLAILIPLPDSWATAGVSLQVWTAILVAYSVFAVAFWAFFTRKARPSPEDSTTAQHLQSGSISEGSAAGTESATNAPSSDHPLAARIDAPVVKADPDGSESPERGSSV